MPKFIGKEVPFLNFSNPGGQSLYPDGLFTYAIGNTTAQALAERLATTKGCSVDLLLLASGDLRHVFFTASELWQREDSLRPDRVNFHVNDFDPVIVARNVIILKIATSINPENQEDIDFLWNVWYNLSLSEDNYKRLLVLIEDLIGCHDNFDDGIKFGTEESRVECCKVLRDWTTVSRSADNVKLERMLLITQNKTNKFGDELESCIFDIDEEFEKIVEQCVLRARVNLFSTAESQLHHDEDRKREIRNLYLTGSTSNTNDRVNPTLLRPFSHTWRVHYDSYIFRGYCPVERDLVKKHQTIRGTCKTLLKEKIADFQKRISSNSKLQARSVQVTFWLGDALELCVSTLNHQMTFDIIDTSNLADHIGLLNVLSCCASRLKRSNQSQLLTGTMVWARAVNSIAEYLNETIGVHSHLLPTVLGIKLADDEELGRGTLELCDVDRIGSDETLTWVKADQKRTPISIENSSDDVVEAFQNLAKRCFLLPIHAFEVKMQTSGIRLSSPTTFLRIIHEAKPTLREPVNILLDRVVESLPKVHVATTNPPSTHPLFHLTWNIIKTATMDTKEAVLEIQVQVSFPKRTNSTIIAFLFENPDDAAFLEYANFSTTITTLSYNGRVHLLSHNARYDTDTEVFTFHILEKDWKTLSPQTVIVVSDMVTENLSKPVLLPSKTTVATAVDVMKVYGLERSSSVVKADTRLDVLEVANVSEKTLGYDAELKIIGDPSLKGSLQTSFTPKEFPTIIELTFSKERKSTKLFLSSPVEKRMCKFQIFRKRSKICCHFPKKKFGLVGEACIQNPALLDVDKLPYWKRGSSDVAFTLGAMFSTKSSLAMKFQSTSKKDPFYDLQESIQIIISQYVEYAEERNVYRVSDPSIDKTEPDITIIVQGVYRYKFMPLVKVLFTDHAAMWDLVTRNPPMETFVLVCQPLIAAAENGTTTTISATQQEQVLLKRLLYTNALRLKQPEGLRPVWVQSFLHPRYPRETAGFTLDELIAEKMKFEAMQHPFESHGQTRMDTAEKSGSFDPGKTHTDESNKKCANCGKVSNEAKRCTGCSDVFYCDRQCQRNNWKFHKSACQWRKT